MKKLLLPFFIVLMLFSVAKAEFVNNIVIIGNERVSSETIILLGDVEKDKEYTDTLLNNIINELYKTNFFSDIKLKILNGTLNIEVTENKIIQTIEINGHVEGKILADTIIIGKSAVIKGDIHFKNTLKTEEGADIDGYIKRDSVGKINTEEDIAIEEIVEREDLTKPKVIPVVHHKEAV